MRAAQRQLAAAGLDGGMVVEARLLAERSTERYAAADLALYLTTPAGSFACPLVQVDGAQTLSRNIALLG